MSTHFKHYKSGDIYGIIYSFDNAGEGICMHAHPTSELEHNTIVLTGSILIYGPNGEDSFQVDAGQIYDFDSSQLHEIISLTDNTSLINIMLGGQPDGYDTLPACELEGVIDFVLTCKIDDFTNPRPSLVH